MPGNAFRSFVDGCIGVEDQPAAERPEGFAVVEVVCGGDKISTRGNGLLGASDVQPASSGEIEGFGAVVLVAEPGNVHKGLGGHLRRSRHSPIAVVKHIAEDLHCRAVVIWQRYLHRSNNNEVVPFFEMNAEHGLEDGGAQIEGG